MIDLSEKQIQILKIAEKLFAENGFDATSVRQIAKEADINVAMISYYFGSKEKLLETLLYYRASDFKADIHLILNNNELDWFEKIEAIIILLVKRIHYNRRVHKIINVEASNGCRSIDIEKFINKKKENYDLIENFIKEGQEAGVFSKTVEIPMIIPTILGTYFNFYYNKKFFRLMYDIEDDNVDNFVFTTLTNHIQRTIKAILTYEN